MRRAVLFDVDGTLVDSMANLRRVWDAWADHHGLDRDSVWTCAKRTVPMETFAQVAPERDAPECLAVLHELEDEDARNGRYTAFPAAKTLLRELPPDSWAVVTGNYAHRVRMRFDRLALPLPRVLVDAASVQQGKPDPEGYLLAAEQLGRAPGDCLVVEDSHAGAQAAISAHMTVWTVNGAAAIPSVHRHYPSLAAAVPDIRTWLRSHEPMA
jgi:mannitol-1-/sugar-/sorbitol-6-phosphatase